MLNTVALDGVAFHHCLAAHSHFLDNNTQLIVHNDGPPPSHFCWRRISGNDLLHYFYYASYTHGFPRARRPRKPWHGACSPWERGVAHPRSQRRTRAPRLLGTRRNEGALCVLSLIPMRTEALRPLRRPAERIPPPPPSRRHCMT